MSNITPIKPNLPSDPPQLTTEQLIAAINRASASITIAGGSKPFLRLLKSNEWVYGSENVDVQPGSRWCINYHTFQHGYCCWVDNGPGKKNELKGEIMGPAIFDKPQCPDPIGGTPFTEQLSFDLKCIDGEDAGTEVHYKTSSTGGKKAVKELLKAFTAQVGVDLEHCCPIVTLDSDYYDHPKYGRTYVPIFTIHGWADIYGNLPTSAALEAPAEEPVAEPVATEPVRTRQRRAPVEPPPPAAPTPTARAHVGQRSRPAR